MESNFENRLKGLVEEVDRIKKDYYDGVPILGLDDIEWLLANSALLNRMIKEFNNYHEDDEDLEGFYHDFRRFLMLDYMDRNGKK